MLLYQLPLFPLRTVLFPGQTLPLHIFEPRYRRMVVDCLQTDRIFGVVLIREGQEVGGTAIPYDVGTAARIEDVEHLSDGRMNIVTIGHERFRIQDYETGDRSYLVGQVSPWPWSDDNVSDPELSGAVQQRLDHYIRLFAQASDADIVLDMTPEHPAALAMLASVVLQIPPEKKQALLETPSVDELLRRVDQLLRRENRALRIMLASSHPRDESEQPFSRN